MGRKAIWAAVAGLVFAGVVLAEDAVRPVDEPLDLPAAWRAVPSTERHKAIGVAEEDADALLMERVYGVQVNANTLILDLAMANGEVNTAVQQLTKGFRVVGKPTYKDNLSVEVVKAVTIRQVIETIERSMQKTRTVLGVNVEEIQNIARETKDTEVPMMGNGAIPGSKGYRRILAKRAAEVDAYKKLAKEIVGAQVTRTTTVREYVVANDRIATALAATLRWQKPTRTVYREDDSCEVTLSVTMRQIIQTIHRTLKRFAEGPVANEEEFVKAVTETKEKTVEATGFGNPRPEGAGQPVAPVGQAQPFYEEKEIIKRVISTEVGQ